MTMSTPTVWLCQTTCPSLEVAQSLADALVGERLAACVSLLPGLTSTYVWQGQLQREAEVLLLIKTTAACWPALLQRLLQLHPYELPELIATAVDAGHADYLQWVAAQVTAPADTANSRTER